MIQLVTSPLDWSSHAIMAVDPSEYHSQKGHGYAVLIGNLKKMHIAHYGNGSLEDVLAVHRRVRAGGYNTITAIEVTIARGVAYQQVHNMCEAVGVYRYIWKTPLEVQRSEVKQHWLGTVKGGDPEVSVALRARFGAPGIKKSPGVLYGLNSHARAALALAVLVGDQMQGYHGLANGFAAALAPEEVSA